MFDPIGPTVPPAAPVDPGAAAWTLPRIAPGEIAQTLREAPAVERPAVALELVDGVDDSALQDLAGTASGRDALASLDDALAEAPTPLGDVEPQRERLASALRGDEGDGGGGGTPVGDTVGTTQTTAQIGANTVTWTNDAQGRPLRAVADLTEVFTDIDRSSAETKAQSDSADRGVEGDQGGHLIGHRFVQDQGLKNLFPQNGNFNVSAYKTLENEWADWIGTGHDVHIDVSLAPQMQDRPDTVRVSYEVTDPATGRVVYDQNVTFENTAGQTFDRVPRDEMPVA